MTNKLFEFYEPVIDSSVNNEPIPVINRANMIEPTDSVREHVSKIIETAVKHSSSLNFKSVVRYKLAERFLNTHSDCLYYVAENEKLGKIIFKDVVSKFCEKYNLGTISMGVQEIIYDQHHVLGSIGFNICTDKTFGFDYMLEEQIVDNFKVEFNTRDNNNSTPILSRLSMDTRGNMNTNNILFNAPKINMPSNIMYPWFDFTPEDLANDFINSTANIIVLYGEPGTGKTTFIKRMLQGIGFTDNRTVNVVDTPAVMNSPELIDKIFMSKHKDIFIFEDVDRHLYSREDGNDVMAGLLNAAEGLASPDVKIIISTNIRNLCEIDSALIRPGRCFRTIEFLKLNQTQQENVRTFLGLDTNSCSNSQSLAEVMNEPASDGMTGNGFL